MFSYKIFVILYFTVKYLQITYLIKKSYLEFVMNSQNSAVKESEQKMSSHFTKKDKHMANNP